MDDSDIAIWPNALALTGFTIVDFMMFYMFSQCKALSTALLKCAKLTWLKKKKKLLTRDQITNNKHKKMPKAATKREIGWNRFLGNLKNPTQHMQVLTTLSGVGVVTEWKKLKSSHIHWSGYV